LSEGGKVEKTELKRDIKGKERQAGATEHDRKTENTRGDNRRGNVGGGIARKALSGWQRGGEERLTGAGLMRPCEPSIDQPPKIKGGKSADDGLGGSMKQKHSFVYRILKKKRECGAIISLTYLIYSSSPGEMAEHGKLRRRGGGLGRVCSRTI